MFNVDRHGRKLRIPPDHEIGNLPTGFGFGLAEVIADRKICFAISIKIRRRDRQMKLGGGFQLGRPENAGTLLNQNRDRRNLGLFEPFSYASGEQRASHHIQITVPVKVGRLRIDYPRHPAKVVVNKRQFPAILKPLNAVVGLGTAIEGITIGVKNIHITVEIHVDEFDAT